jgi:hypothetical protein
MRAVTHHQPPATIVALAGVAGDVGVDLGLQRFRPNRMVIEAVGLLGNYGEHGSYLRDRRWRADLA